MDWFSFFFPGKAATQRLIAHLESEVNRLSNEKAAIEERLTKERDFLSAKVDRMELILMPLQSSAGAAYVRSVNPAKQISEPSTVRQMFRKPHLSWAEVQNQWYEKEQKEAETEKAASSKEIQ